MKKNKQNIVPSPPHDPDHLDPSNPPPVLNQYGSEVWRQTLEDLDRDKRAMHVLNRQTLIAFCQATSDAKTAGDMIDQNGILMDGGREGMKRNPAVAIRLQSLGLVRILAKELGLTPSSSSKLPVAAPEPNPFDEF